MLLKKYMVFVFVLLFLNTVFYSTLLANEIKVYNYDEAIELAKKEEKHIFLFFWADWCKYCVQFKTEVLTDEKVISLLNDNFIFVSTDVEEKINKGVVKKYKVRSLPHLVLLNHETKTVGILLGFIAADTLKQILEFVYKKEYLEKAFEPK